MNKCCRKYIPTVDLLGQIWLKWMGPVKLSFEICNTTVLSKQTLKERLFVFSTSLVQVYIIPFSTSSKPKTEIHFITIGDCFSPRRLGRHFELPRQSDRGGHDRHRHLALLEDSLKPQPRTHHLLQGSDGLHW